VLSGELDLATTQELQDKIDEIMVPGQPIVLDLADLTFLDTSAVHCLVRTFEETGRPSFSGTRHVHFAASWGT
jgi:anti-anti-sigma factor